MIWQSEREGSAMVDSLNGLGAHDSPRGVNGPWSRSTSRFSNLQAGKAGRAPHSHDLRPRK